MSVYFHEIRDYLDAYPLRGHNGGFTTAIEMLYEIYTMHNTIDSKELRDWFRKLRNQTASLSDETADAIFCSVCELCLMHEQLAFSHGIAAGIHLMTEVNMLP